MTSLRLCENKSGEAGGVGWPVEQFGPYTFTWDGVSKVMLSSTADGSGKIMVDDLYSITVTNSFGTTTRSEEMARIYYGVPQPPRDITYLLKAGDNTITFKTWSTICCYYGHTEFWIASTSEIRPIPGCKIDINLGV